MKILLKSNKLEDPNPIKINRKITLSQDYCDELKDQINSLLQSQAKKDEEIGLDGSTWKFEITKHGNYYLSRAWSPKSGPEYELGKLLFERAARYGGLGELY